MTLKSKDLNKDRRGVYVCAIVAFTALRNQVLGEKAPFGYYDGMFPIDYPREFRGSEGYATSTLSGTAKGIAFIPKYYSDTPSPMFDDPNSYHISVVYRTVEFLRMADSFFKVAFSNESLWDNVYDKDVPLTERAAFLRRLTDHPRSPILYSGLLSEFRKAMGASCSAFPQGCYTTPTTLSKASEDLNEFLDGFYSQLIEAFNKAASKLEQNEHSEDYRSLCTPATFARIWCEVEILQSMMGEDCDDVTTYDCSPSRGIPTCIWREIDVDDFDNMTFTVRVRLIHLGMANAFCGHRMENRSLIEMGSRALSIANGFLSAERLKSLGMLSETQAIDKWMGKVLGIVEGVAERQTTTTTTHTTQRRQRQRQGGWPTSNTASRSYALLAGNISRALTKEWSNFAASNNLSQPLNEKWANVLCESFGSFVFYRAKDSDYALPVKVKTLKEKWGKHEAENTSVLFLQRPEGNILVWKSIDTCSDLEKRDWMKENEAGLADTLGKWKEQDASTLQSKLAAFRSGSHPLQQCFRDVAIVKCAYSFVWYELSWTYYHATSDCEFCIKMGSEDYRQCLDIVFLG